MTLLETAVPAADLSPQMSNYLIKSILVGASGTGKTTSACTVPGRKLLLDFDNRSESVAGESSIDIIKLLPSGKRDEKVWLKAEGLADEIWDAINKDSFPYDALILDGLSTLNRWALWWTFSVRVKDTDGRGKTKGMKPIETGPGGVPARMHYNVQMPQLANFVLALLPIPKHLILTAHFDRFEDQETQIVNYWPKMIGNTRTEVGAWFNETYECVRKGSKNRRYYWNTGRGGEMGFIKSAMNKRNAYWKDPIEINFEESPVGFEKLLEIRFDPQKDVKI